MKVFHPKIFTLLKKHGPDLDQDPDWIQIQPKFGTGSDFSKMLGWNLNPDLFPQLTFVRCNVHTGTVRYRTCK
jgi:hypothetical protein